MNKRHVKQLIFVITVFFAYSILSYYIVQHTAMYIHQAMVWNLFLALMPLAIYYLFQYMVARKKTSCSILLFICWLLLFPNVPYLVTDFIHITPLTFYTLTSEGAVYAQELWVWVELLHIAFGVWFGVLMGYRSLWNMQQFVQERWSIVTAWSMVVIVSILSGFGVFLGRFLRLNSWDIFHPASLMGKIHQYTDVSFAIPFTLCFGLFVFATYVLYYYTQVKKGATEEKLVCKQEDEPV